MTTIISELIEGEDKRDRKGRRITKAARRVELLTAYRASGLTIEAFARAEGISRHTVAKWLYLEKRSVRQTAVRFTEMKVGMPAPSGWSFEVTLPNGLLVRAASAAGLAELIGLVRS